MKTIYNKIIPFKGFAAITLFGVLFVREGVIVTERIILHETIHTKQRRELLFIPFYILYVLEWLVKLCYYGKQAYRNISFEREAYSNDKDIDYIKKRKRFAFLGYL
jgi:hypothetical protein